MQKQYGRFAALFLAAALCGVSAAGCGKKQEPAVPVTESDDACSLVIEDAAPPQIQETEAQTEARTEAAAEAQETQTEAATEPAVYTDDTFAWNTEVTYTAEIDRDGIYTAKDDVALYIHTFGELPDNFITKKQAEKLGWSGGSLEPYAPGKCIGGNRFGNYEGILPEKDGREYTECDIDTLGAKSRGAKRIVFSNDGLIYYTEDHYETFELLYGDP